MIYPSLIPVSVRVFLLFFSGHFAVFTDFNHFQILGEGFVFRLPIIFLKLVLLIIVTRYLKYVVFFVFSEEFIYKMIKLTIIKHFMTNCAPRVLSEFPDDPIGQCKETEFSSEFSFKFKLGNL